MSLHPALFAAYPVLFLWSQNLGETNPRDVVVPLVLVVAVALATTVLLAIPFHDGRRAALIVTPLVVGLLAYGHAAALARPLHVPALLQQAGWIALVILGFVAAIRLGARALGRVDTALDRIGLILVAIALVVIVPYQISAAATRSGAPQQGVVEGQASSGRPMRDVYYLILDRYGSDRALSLRFGYSNDLVQWLEPRGFRVLPDSHANYVRTNLSLATTLNMSHLQELLPGMPPDSQDLAPVHALLQNSRVARQFKELGYGYTHIGSYYPPTQTDEAADRNLYIGGPSDFADVLYDTSAIPVLRRRLGLRSSGTKPDRAYENGKFAWSALAGLRDEPGPKFVFAHILLPHPPYVFERDGSHVDPAVAATMSEDEQFDHQITWTNSQLRSFVDSLLALPEERRPIIILQADEGPYPLPYQRDIVGYDWATASGKELEMKYGILNAWYVPGAPDIGLYDDITSINTFPALFSGYFGLDVPMQPDRIYTSGGKLRPYDLTEITDRLRP